MRTSTFNIRLVTYVVPYLYSFAHAVLKQESNVRTNYPVGIYQRLNELSGKDRICQPFWRVESIFTIRERPWVTLECLERWMTQLMKGNSASEKRERAGWMILWCKRYFAVMLHSLATRLLLHVPFKAIFLSCIQSNKETHIYTYECICALMRET